MGRAGALPPDPHDCSGALRHGTNHCSRLWGEAQGPAGVMPAVRSTTAASQLNRHLPCLVRAGGKHKVAMVAMEEHIQSAVQNNSSGKHGSCLRPSGWPQLGQKRQRRQQQSHSSLCLL